MTPDDAHNQEPKKNAKGREVDSTGRPIKVKKVVRATATEKGAVQYEKGASSL